MIYLPLGNALVAKENKSAKRCRGCFFHKKYRSRKAGAPECFNMACKNLEREDGKEVIFKLMPLLEIKTHLNKK